ncbi:MAG: DUF1972 domain-containing protein [Porticoccaceae bacterium]|nr:DUF1972 domain-containing protein [Porticoccaceae bacterium]
MKSIAIVGTVGIPAQYGGFETLVENLVQHHDKNQIPCEVVVYCSGKAYPERSACYGSATLRYIPISANGASSVLYDIVSLLHALWRGADVILLLGVSGAIALPLIRVISRVRIVTNVDGVEWKREKWQGLAKWFLRVSEKLAVRFSDQVIADNGGIAQHVERCYGQASLVIAYGGDHATKAKPSPWQGNLPEKYALAICRIEPENNVAMILEAFANQDRLSLVFVGNWDSSEYGRALRSRYTNMEQFYLLDAVYDVGRLYTLRRGAAFYLHGHSAGGTNPSLVEMMHFGIPIFAYDCVFNRFTTEDKAIFFKTPAQLAQFITELSEAEAARVGQDMAETAREKFTWEAIGGAYFATLLE